MTSLIFERTVELESIFFINNSLTNDFYALSLHDALPIYFACGAIVRKTPHRVTWFFGRLVFCPSDRYRSEEHTSELQSRGHLVCRLLLEKKNPSVMPSIITNTLYVLLSETCK